MGNWSSKSDENKAKAAGQPPSSSSYASSSASSSSRSQTLTSFSGRHVSSPSASTSRIINTSPSSAYSGYSNYTSTYIVPQPTPAVKPATPVIGNQLVKHGADNYIIPKAKQTSDSQINSINIPHKKVADKYLVRVCPQYNSRTGCRAPICKRFHVCFSWVQEKCTKATCENDHDFLSSHNHCIVNSLTSRRDFSMTMLREILQNNHKFNRKTKRNEHNGICMFNIMKRCNKSPCSLTHVNKSYIWEIKENNKWIQLAYEQSSGLEALYCQPEQEIVDVAPPPDIRALQKLKSLFTKHTNWKADFTSMKLFCDGDEYDLRRLATPTDISNVNRLATRWIWYWQDDGGSWHPYLDGCGAKFYIFALSDYIEYQYNFSNESELEVTLSGNVYGINLCTMTQTNRQTGKVRNVRRRPTHFDSKDEDIYFDQFFSSVSSDQTPRHSVLQMSSEYAFVKNLMEASLSSVNLLKVERIINNHLWKAYQNKKAQLKVFYNNDIAIINEQYMFHGTKHSVIDQICKDNFDWRLYGTNVGNVYGHGVYFSNEARLSDGYSETNSSGVKVMFIVLVLVGSMTIGNSSMKFPPNNSVTGRCFDTTCDDEQNSKIFVKYNRDEYYPAYVAHYQRPF